ncbi:hypothetical protein [Petrotoga sp. 9PWA.NaAc.5.4]|uniref:hypothetical protein n=1 Tax=Petrotoga sp. 9PWA.NaAc.5.4 TaxID=1434328 RepID=UPI000CC3254F|nr:hypothetical protein [Petrotoga sp. 9PWA.NaAc.5.4]PNR95840.1 hypothetical protein X924_03630 [Petrotoga sp. 9PWA.NaAc.5.4]
MFDKIYIFHYHYLRGGVTTVVKNIVRALKDKYDFTLFGSKKMGIEGIEDILTYDNVNFVDFPELSYIYPEQTDKKTFNELKDSISKKLNKIYDSNAIFWVHNYHLGKNPAFTDALIDFITKNNYVSTILQIHDFPECARWENYDFVKKHVNLSLYPVKNNIVYTTINLSDYERLLKSGIPEENLFYLPNAAEFKKSEDTSKTVDKNNVIKILQNLNFNVKNDFLNFLYPTRTLRRKNILEAILINRLYGKSNLLITLPANSDKERPYEKVVKETFKSEKIAGAWAISAKDPTLFPYILEISDLFFSSSVLEGFGMIYLESKFNHKNFFTRKLEVVKDFKNISKISYYDGFYVPLSKKEKSFLKNQYQNLITNIPIDNSYKELLKEDLQNIFSQEFVDFSFLSVDLQKEYCLKEEEKLHKIKEINKEIFEKIDKLIFNKNIDQGININEFSIEAYAKKIMSLISKIQDSKDKSIEKINKEIDENILKSFLKLENIRLLYFY